MSSRREFLAEMAAVLSPLSLNPLTRDLWGMYDPLVIAQLAPLYDDPCYTIKFYKAPDSQHEVVPARGYVPYGLKITPGSLIFGWYLPCVPVPGAVQTSAPGAYTVQITDVSLKRQWFSSPLASLFLASYKPTYQSNAFSGAGSFPNLLEAPYPVVGNGVFKVDIQETSGVQQRIELVFGVLEVCAAAAPLVEIPGKGWAA